MTSAAPHTQLDTQDQHALPPEVLQDVLAHLTRGLDVLDMTIAAEMEWLARLDSQALADVPLDVSSSFRQFVDMALTVLESNGFTSSSLGYRSRTQEFQEELKGLLRNTNKSYLKILEDAKKALLAAISDNRVENSITESKAAIGSTRAEVLEDWNDIFTDTSWFPVVSLPSSSLAWRSRDGAPRLPVYNSTEEDTTDWVSLAVQCVLQIHKGDMGGDILVFLPGRSEIENAIGQIQAANLDTAHRHCYGQLIAVPLYKKLPPKQQSLAFTALDPRQPFGILPPTDRMHYKRKVIFATDVAAWSLSDQIKGICFVVDSGLIKQERFDPIYSAIFLQPEAISRDILAARQDCAGGVRKGVFYYLYSDEDFRNLPDVVDTHFETSRFTAHLANGYRIGMTFEQILANHMLQSSSAVVVHAVKELQTIGYLDDRGNVTEYGRALNRYPRIDPRQVHFLEICLKRQCFDDGAKLVGMLSAGVTFTDIPDKRWKQADVNGRTPHHPTGDHISLLNLYKSFWENEGRRSERLRRGSHEYHVMELLKSARATYQRCCATIGLAPVDQSRKEAEGNADKAILESLLEAYPDQVAQYEGNRRYALDAMSYLPSPKRCVSLASRLWDAQRR